MGDPLPWGEDGERRGGRGADRGWDGGMEERRRTYGRGELWGRGHGVKGAKARARGRAQRLTRGKERTRGIPIYSYF